MKKFLKKSQRKFPLLLKRSSALIGAFMVFICSLTVPSSAVDWSPDSNVSTMRPLFDYDYIAVTYDVGQKAVFNLKDVFFNTFKNDDTIEYILTDDAGNNSITVTLRDVDFSQAIITDNGNSVRLPYWLLTFDFNIEQVSFIEIGCSETIYNYSIFGTAIDSYVDEFYFFDSSFNPVNSSFKLSKSGYYYYPLYSYDSSGSVVGRSLSSVDLSSSINNASYSSSIVPSYNNGLSSLSSLLPSSVLSKYLYFSDFTTNISVPLSGSTLPSYLRMSITYIPTNYLISFKDYHDAYFPAYRTDNVAVDFTGWLTTALGGFLGFQFIPGVSLAALLAFILGIGVFLAFLRFFAGG